MKILGTDHTSFTVSSLERSLKFYVETLGFSVRSRRQIRDDYFRKIVDLPESVVEAAFLSITGSDHILELFEYVVPRGIPADVRNNNPGSAHLSLLVEDLHAAYEELKAKGVQFRSPPVPIDAGPARGGMAAYMLDPDGITIELYQPAGMRR